MTIYYRPIVQTDPCKPANARLVAGGWTWFCEAERIERGGKSSVVSITDMPTETVERISSARTPITGLSMDAPRIMGILNVTPDSFSDGGKFHATEHGVSHAKRMIADGADIIDIGGESTRPGAQEIDIKGEVARTCPVIQGIRAESAVAISIDTRKAPVADAAIVAGANLVNDVSAFDFDPAMAETVATSGLPVCLMHAQGGPETMQNDPRYDDVLLDVYDYLSAKVDAAMAMGIPRERIIVDPGVGFGKKLEHNIRLLKGISLFHGLGCPILLGASRKRFIGTIGNASEADQRAAGSVAVAMNAVSQGIQILRVHDVAETRQALSLHLAVTTA